MFAPRTGRADLRVRRESRPDPREREPPQPASLPVPPIQLVHPAVRRDPGRADRAVVAAVVEPPLPDALLLELLVQLRERGRLVRVAPVEAVRIRCEAARGRLEFALRGRLRLGEPRVVPADRRVHVERGVDALGLQVREERGRIREQTRVPVPPGPLVRGLPVGVHDERVQRHPVALERRQQRVLVVGRAVRLVLGEPGAERPLRREHRRPGERAQVGQRAGVVVAVPEEVSVLIGARVCGPRREPVVRRANRGGRVVEQVPAALVEQPGMQGELIDRAGLTGVVVEAAIPATERLTGRAAELRVHADATTVDGQVEGGVRGRDRAAVQPVAQRHGARADLQLAVARARPEPGPAGRAVDGVERGPVLERPVRRVLQAQQRRAQHLHAQIAGENGLTSYVQRFRRGQRRPRNRDQREQ